MLSRGRVVIGAAAITVVGVACGVLIGTSQTREDVAGQGREVTEQVEEFSADPVVDPVAVAAAAEAVRTGQPVAVESQFTEMREIYVNPDGTNTAVMHTVPQRVRRGDSWVDVDTTLALDDAGRAAPQAAALDVSFSGGGDKELLRISSGKAQLGLAWPGALPEPQLTGNMATYPQVLPGVDLQLKAEADTLTQVLVVHDAEAAAQPALRSLRFDVEVEGGRLETRKDGGLEVVDASGEVVLSSPPAIMWDSSGADSTGDEQLPTGRAHAAREGDQVAEVAATVTGDALTLVPDRKLLAGQDTEYPLYIDPIWKVPETTRAMVNRAYPGEAYTDWTATEGVGHFSSPDDGTHLKRLFWNYDTSVLRGRQILGATFSVFQTHQYSCTKSRVNLWTAHAFAPGVTWNTQPGVLRLVGSADTALGRTGCSPGGGRVEIDARSAAEDVVNRDWSRMGLALFAVNEADVSGWKRFQPDAIFSVNYNTRPHVPAQLQGAAPEMPCAVGEQMPVIGERNPLVKAHLQDPDAGGRVLGDFELWHPHEGELLEKIETGPLGPDDWHYVRFWNLPDGPYAWWVQASDTMLESGRSQWCHFEVDTTPPPAPVAVQSGQYPTDAYAGGLGVPGTFTVDGGGNPDVVSFGWSVNSDAPVGTVVPAVRGGSASFEYSPNVFGPNVLRVWSRDRAGNMSQPVVYEFKVRGASARAWWRLDEASGTRAADSRSQFTGMVAGSPARTDGVWKAMDAGDRALRFDGVDDQVGVSGVGVQPGQNFSVSAWVRPSKADGSRTAVSMSGASRPVLALGHLDASGRWVAGVAAADAAGELGWSRAVGTTPAQLGQWAHLLVTYNAAVGQLSLYVNGFLEATVQAPANFDPVTDLTVGRASTGGNGTPTGSGFFAGEIDDVRLFAGTVDADEAFRLFNEAR